MKLSKSISAASVVLLSACGGSNTPETIAVVTIDELVERAEGAVVVFEGLGGDHATATLFDDLPTGQDVEYTGFAFVGSGVRNEFSVEQYDFAALGSATMTANFVTQAVDGVANNFFQADDPTIEDPANLTGSRIAGSLEFDFAQLEADTNVYGGTISGSITTTESETINIDEIGGGSFLGPNAEVFVGGNVNDSGPDEEFFEVSFILVDDS